ncbi:hypothetical protein CTAYLR_008674 [Chrysophaeum taylorii]|uniref:Protein kinase domain-containing protein n=1 Tax=Chrysophaeum taylorii TaxID=2483200 RepID=A0AAD7UNU0_9STRA|nr:hypothetical protein CTAYLR_008674 [Chrysophaeum taylorii]
MESSPHWLPRKMLLRSSLSWSSERRRRVRRTRRPLPAEVLEDGLEIPTLDLRSLGDVRCVGGGSQGWILWCEKGALKVLRPALNAKLGLEGFRQECNILARLSHENICRLRGVGTTPDHRPCALLEWVETDVSKALRLREMPAAAVEIEREWPSSSRLRLAVELSSALDYLHAMMGTYVILHRDLKPDNFGLKRGTLKLLDFGLAVAVRKDPGYPPTTAERFKLSGKVGSIRYMAPECGRAEPYGLGADIYSFAISTWEILALSGRPFDHLTIPLHRATVICGPHRPSMPLTWDRRLLKLFAKAWHPDPALRPSAKHLHQTILDLRATKGDPLNRDHKSLLARWRFPGRAPGDTKDHPVERSTTVPSGNWGGANSARLWKTVTSSRGKHLATSRLRTGGRGRVTLKPSG